MAEREGFTAALRAFVLSPSAEPLRVSSVGPESNGVPESPALSTYKKRAPMGPFFIWRRGRDSNPRTVAGQWFSRPPHSTTLPPLRLLELVSRFSQEHFIQTVLRLHINRITAYWKLTRQCDVIAPAFDPMPAADLQRSRDGQLICAGE
jgi:hypothetical protein